MKILSLTFGHDASAAIIKDGEIVASVSEERFTRIKNDGSFPINSIRFCLNEMGISSKELDCLAIPRNKPSKLIDTFFKLTDEQDAKWGASGDHNLAAKIKNTISKSKNPMKLPIYQPAYELSENCVIHFCHHHRAHAASAYFTSGLTNQKCLVITMDGLGDGLSTTVWLAENNNLKKILEYDGSASLGWFYGNATEALGWRQASEEWKVMGLAPYGNPRLEELEGYYPVYKNGKLVKPHNYGEWGLWNDHGAYHYHGQDSLSLKRIADSMGQEDFAATVQAIAEQQALEFIVPLIKKYDVKACCFAGGFFLNVKFNQKLWETGLLKFQWIYPNSGDPGLPVGAALDAYYKFNNEKKQRKLRHMYYGPEFGDEQIKKTLEDRGLNYTYTDDIPKITAKYLSKNYVVGWFQGKMEDGPRALGCRSILMSPTRAENKDIINAKVKYREKFRPFCPSILENHADDYLENWREELFMVTAFRVKEQKTSKIPAVVHVDGTCRPQFVSKEINPIYASLIEEFGKLTGEYVLLNTSFNIKGEPIVCNPREAIKCFFDTGIDVLVMGNYYITKPSVDTQ